ncbi:MAG: hypothetical protein ACI8TL_002120 [Natronomonas sp.]|jgi:hypothetical protein
MTEITGRLYDPRADRAAAHDACDALVADLETIFDEA